MFGSRTAANDQSRLGTVAEAGAAPLSISKGRYIEVLAPSYRYRGRGLKLAGPGSWVWMDRRDAG